MDAWIWCHAGSFVRCFGNLTTVADVWALSGLNGVQNPVDVVAGAGVNARFVGQAASGVDGHIIGITVTSHFNFPLSLSLSLFRFLSLSLSFAFSLSLSLSLSLVFNSKRIRKEKKNVDLEYYRMPQETTPTAAQR